MKIVYWTGTGNTEAMAQSIAKGIQESGKEAELINESDVNMLMINSYQVILISLIVGNLRFPVDTPRHIQGIYEFFNAPSF